MSLSTAGPHLSISETNIHTDSTQTQNKDSKVTQIVLYENRHAAQCKAAASNAAAAAQSTIKPGLLQLLLQTGPSFTF